jgi:hypothetical protein
MQSTSGSLPWGPVEVALRRVAEARQPPARPGCSSWEFFASSHRDRVWTEAQGILEDLQMLRARVEEVRGKGLGAMAAAAELGFTFAGAGGCPPPPALLLIPLSCGHNLPWLPAESALLACALRQAFPALSNPPQKKSECV